MSEDYDSRDVAEKRAHPYHQALEALRLLLDVGLTKKSPGISAEQERVRTWAREHFNLADDETIMVSELPVPIRAARRSKRTSCSGRKPDVANSRFSSRSRRSSQTTC